MPKVGMEPVRRKALVDATLRAVGDHGSLTVTMSEIARHAGVSPMTVSRAYSLAESEGLLERLRGKGMAVAATRRTSQTQAQRLALLEPQIESLARQARELELTAEPVLRRLDKLLKE